MPFRRSIASESFQSFPRSSARRFSSTTNGLRDLSKSELEQRAKKADIPGRSKMSKDQLLEALAKAS